MMASMTSGQRLMSVWQAVAMLDPGHSATKSTARKLSVQDVTRSLARICTSANYSDRVFMDNFPNASVDFNDYVNYVKVCLRDHSVPMATVEDEFEMTSWELCKDCYSLHHCSMKEGEVFKIWQIFNRLCVQGTIPPVMEYDDMQWLGEKFAKGAKQRWSSYHDGQLTFMEALVDLDSVCFKVLSPRDVERVVDSVHSWLVREICLTGWMTKRTRKQAGWTSWQKRWFVLKPGLLSYYTSASTTEKKGDIILTTRSRVDELDDLKTLIRHYPNRFRVTNAPFIELELSNEEFAGKDAWMRAIRVVIKAVKAGVSPSEYMLSDIRKAQRGERLSSDDTAKSLRIMSMCQRGTSDGFDEDSEDDVDGARCSSASGSTANFDDDSDLEQNRNERSADNAGWIIPLVMSRIKDIAAKLGDEDATDMDEEKFNQFLKNLGIILQHDDEQSLFDELSNDGVVENKVFLKYLVEVLLFFKVPDDSVSANIFTACIQAYDKTVNMINFPAFTEALWRKQRNHYVHQMMAVLDSLDDKSGNTLTELRCAFSREQAALGTGMDDKEPTDEKCQEIFNEAMRVSVDGLAQYLHGKWNDYPIKTDATDTKPQRIPHEKTLLDIVFYSSENPDGALPNSTRVEIFTWRRSSRQGKSGTALLSADFDGNIALAEPNSEVLSYYGASCANQEGQLHTSLIYEHNIVSYRKPDQDLETNGGHRRLCLARQDVSTLFCPLEDNSGLLILGKQEGESLDLNAFHIPKYTTIYVPSGTIFCTNFMEGMWRTMAIQRAFCETALVAQADNEDSGQLLARDYNFFKFT